jgi:hypothetical protein
MVAQPPSWALSRNWTQETAAIRPTNLHEHRRVSNRATERFTNAAAFIPFAAGEDNVATSNARGWLHQARLSSTRSETVVSASQTHKYCSRVLTHRRVLTLHKGLATPGKAVKHQVRNCQRQPNSQVLFPSADA